MRGEVGEADRGHGSAQAETHQVHDLGAREEPHLLDRGQQAEIKQVRLLTGSEVVNLVGLCLGGTMSTVGLAYLAAHGQSDRVGWMTVTNTLVDFSIPGDLGVFADAAGIAKLERAIVDLRTMIVADTGRDPGQSRTTRHRWPSRRRQELHRAVGKARSSDRAAA